MYGDYYRGSQKSLSLPEIINTKLNKDLNPKPYTWIYALLFAKPTHST